MKRDLFLMMCALAMVVFAPNQIHAQSFSVLHNFTGGSDGGFPLDGFAVDSSGNLFGTTSTGGSSGTGVVFEISQSGQQQVLYSFKGGSDGANPNARLIFDASGNLYGTTYAGGTHGLGTIFQVTRAGQETVLYSFAGGADGANPESKLVFDTVGDLYGTTFAGGAYGGGTAFVFTKGGVEKVLHSFGNGTDGANPVAGLTLTKKWGIFGTTSAGGAHGYGTVFVIWPTTSGWQEMTLHDFALQGDGGTPYGGLVFDQSGRLYGTTTAGGQGGESGGGTIFNLTPTTSGWNFSVLDVLAGWGISGTYRNLLLDASGNIYATTHCDGNYGAGTVYKLTSAGSSWTYDQLYTFTGGNDGLFSFSNLVFDQQGNLYGTTKNGGTNGYGVVFKIIP